MRRWRREEKTDRSSTESRDLAKNLRGLVRRPLRLFSFVPSTSGHADEMARFCRRGRNNPPNRDIERWSNDRFI